MNVKNSFKSMMKQRGIPDSAIEELWKWFDYSEKKGVASF